MGKIKNRNDLTEAEEIKKRWQIYTEELYKKDFRDSDNYSGVVTHLETDFLVCKVKWAFSSITNNKASGGDGNLTELFQILKDDAVKHAAHNMSHKFRKLNSGRRTRKDQFSFQSQRKAMSKNVQITILLCSFHMLASLC